MALEEEMRHEIARLEKELKEIDAELEKLNKKVFDLTTARKKKEHDLRILAGTVDEDYIRQVEEESLEKIIGHKIIR